MNYTYLAFNNCVQSLKVFKTPLSQPLLFLTYSMLASHMNAVTDMVTLTVTIPLMEVAIWDFCF